MPGYTETRVVPGNGLSCVTTLTLKHNGTPKINRNGREFEMPSKLCPHIQVLDSRTLDAISRVQPPMIKTMDMSRHSLQAIRSAAPRALIVARKYVDSQDFYDPLYHGITYAEMYGDVLDLVDAVEVYNEAVNSSTPRDQIALFDTFQGVFAYRIWELNNSVRVGLFCLPTGNFAYPGEPKLTDFPKSLALPINKVFICLHEYSWYTWTWEVGARCLRYRQQMQGLRGYQVLITECGLTHAVVYGQPDVGWRTGVGRDVFIDGAIWYDSELQEDDYVVGAALFTCGQSYGWDTFECTAEWEEAATQGQPPQPKPDETVDDFIRRNSWDKVGVDYNPEAALARYATQRGLGKPETQEFDLQYHGQMYRVQAFVLGIVFCVVGDWSNIRHISW